MIFGSQSISLLFLFFFPTSKLPFDFEDSYLKIHVNLILFMKIHHIFYNISCLAKPHTISDMMFLKFSIISLYSYLKIRQT